MTRKYRLAYRKYALTQKTDTRKERHEGDRAMSYAFFPSASEAKLFAADLYSKCIVKKSCRRIFFINHIRLNIFEPRCEKWG